MNDIVRATPDVNTLRRFRNLSRFDLGQLESLSSTLEIEQAQAGALLIPRGCNEDYSLYLLQGELKTMAADGVEKTFSSDDSSDIEPIAQLRPSIYDVYATSPVKYLRIYRVQLTCFAQAMSQASYGGEGVEVFELDDIGADNDLALQLYEDMISGHLKLPSLPDVALRIQQAFNTDDVDVGSVANIIQSDPAITAKMLMVANSPLYRGQTQIENLKSAIVRIGMQSVKKLVLTYSVNELFTARTSIIKQRMCKLWIHSRKVAALSRVLASLSKQFDPEMAQLAGLLHDLGVIAILQYVQDDPRLCEDEKMLDQTIHSLSGQVTSLLLKRWHFADELIVVAEECEDWFRNPADEADLCDLIIVAQLHSYIGMPQMRMAPPLSKLPALTKLGLGDVGPDMSLEILEQSKDDIREIERLLGVS